ncbi:DcrB/PsbP domain-containing protein [Pseudomonas huanghezhanensis]|uniref:polyribonucleotide nucleotidyltransferase n=1 Tax=Pseudomonas huanghezhanensis TaxID=3002903 RepID=UPI002286B38B|nr:polyribonucleotide nucleotidyltransferase [Pseudomonas sp. BSw22131]
MRLFSVRTFLLLAALSVGLTSANLSAATKHAPAHAPAKNTPTGQKVSMLGGKFVFYLPKEYVKSPMPEIDDKAKAAGVTGSVYMNKPAKRVVIITETPIASGTKVGPNDKKTLDGLIAETLEQQKTSYQHFKKIGEKTMVRKGLGLRQMDIAGDVEGGRVISSTVAAASDRRTAMVNVISLEKDTKAHSELLKGITGSK